MDDQRDIDTTQEIPAVDSTFFASDGTKIADDEDPEDFLPPPRTRLGKATLVLSAIVLIGGGFLIGVAVQKHHGTSTSTAAPRFGNFARGEGAGAFANTGNFPNFGAGGTAPSGTGSTGSGTSTATGVPAVIGTITKVTGDTIVVKNFAGKEMTVKLTSTTAVSNANPTSGLKAGETVTVRGTTASNGTVTATAVSAK
jgi:hypothetical protein